MKLVKKTFGMAFVGHSNGVRPACWALWRCPNPAHGRYDVKGAPKGETILVATFSWDLGPAQPAPEKPYIALGLTQALNATVWEPFGRWLPDTPDTVREWKRQVREQSRSAARRGLVSALRKQSLEDCLAKVGA